MVNRQSQKLALAGATDGTSVLGGDRVRLIGAVRAGSEGKTCSLQDKLVIFMKKLIKSTETVLIPDRFSATLGILDWSWEVGAFRSVSVLGSAESPLLGLACPYNPLMSS